MTLTKAIRRLTLHKGSERTLKKLFIELSAALTKWDNTIDEYRESEAKNTYRKVKNSILMITNNESNYKIVISDILSCNTQIVAYPTTTESRKFSFIF